MDTDVSTQADHGENGESSAGIPLITTPAVEAQRAEASLHSETQTPRLPLEGSGDTFTWGAYFQAIGILIALLALFWFVLRLIRKVGSGRFLPTASSFSRRDLGLEAQLPLGRDQSLQVVRYLDKRLLLGVTEQQITLLDSDEIIDREGDTPHDEHKISEFRRILEKSSADSDAGGSGSADPSGSGTGRSGR